MKHLSTLLILIITVSLFLVPVSTSFATEGDVSQSINLTNPLGDNTNSVGDVLSRIIDGLQTLAIPIVGIMILVGGFQILFAGGDPEKFKKGKKTILYAVVGYAIILVANGIDELIRNILTQSVD